LAAMAVPVARPVAGLGVVLVTGFAAGLLIGFEDVLFAA